MIQLLITVAAFVVAISVLVVIHELGHYSVARLMGVKVLRFSLGFGKPLWSRPLGRDRTEWVIAAVPLGGYVKMLDEQEGEVGERELPRAFNRKPLWRRALIVLAGPLANFLFAIGAYASINMVGIEGIRPVVGKVMEGSLGQRAGFLVGDEILSIDGQAVQSWNERRLYLYERALDHATVRFSVRDRDRIVEERLLDLSSLTAADVGAGLLERQVGLAPELPDPLAVIGEIEKGSPAALGGLRKGDRIVAVDGKVVRVWADLVGIVSARPGESLRFTVERNGHQEQLNITPAAVERGGKTFGRIGAGVALEPLPAEYKVVIRYPPWNALIEGTETTWRMSVLTLKMLWKMLKLEVSTKTISGPLTIAQYAGVTAQQGLEWFVLFLGAVSVGLGVLNLLPVPVLDGGHLLFYAVESVKGSPLSERSLQWGQQIGIAVLFALMALAFYNDIVRLLH